MDRGRCSSTAAARVRIATGLAASGLCLLLTASTCSSAPAGGGVSPPDGGGTTFEQGGDTGLPSAAEVADDIAGPDIRRAPELPEPGGREVVEPPEPRDDPPEPNVNPPEPPEPPATVLPTASVLSAEPEESAPPDGPDTADERPADDEPG